MDYLENPDRIDHLDRAASAALFARVKTLEGRLFARLLCGDDSTQPASQNAEDKLLTADQAAAMLGVTKGWVYRRGAKLGLAHRLGDGTLRFSRDAIQQFIVHSRENPASACRKKVA